MNNFQTLKFFAYKCILIFKYSKEENILLILDTSKKLDRPHT